MQKTEYRIFYFPVAKYTFALRVFDEPFAHYLEHQYTFINKKERVLADIELHVEKEYLYFLDTQTRIKKYVDRQDAPTHAAWDYMLAAYLLSHVVKQDIFFIHASSFMWTQSSYIFVGPSGMGKTTVTESVPKANLLSDDTAIIMKKGKKYYCFASAFDKKNVSYKRLIQHPLKNIFILNKKRINNIRSISLEQQIEILMKNTFYFPFLRSNTKYNGNKDQFYKDCFRLVCDLVSRVPISQLDFQKDISIIDFITHEENKKK